MLVLLLVSAGLPAVEAATGPSILNQTSTGLVAQDSLTTGTKAYWTFGGDAIAENASHAVNENSSGLFVGIQAPAAGTWAGYYAVTPDATVMLFHTTLTDLYQTVPANSFNTGMYVQTSTGVVNYIACVAEVDTTGYSWDVVIATGNPDQATSFTTEYTLVGGPMTEDCTIITNGSNMAMVYFGSNLVFSSSTLNLQMPSPFNAYLEVESTYGGGMLYGNYKDYYALKEPTITVNGIPPGDTARVVGTTDNLIASGVAASNGTAVVNVAPYLMPLQGYISVVNSKGSLTATTSTTTPAMIWAGNVYGENAPLAPPPPRTSHLTVTTQDTAGRVITGYYTVLSSSGAQLATGFTPVVFTLNDSQTYTVDVQNYGDMHFAYWLDTRSNDSLRTVSLTRDATLVAVYVNVSATASHTTFAQTGIPASGVNWGVTVNGATKSGTGTSIIVSGLARAAIYIYAPLVSAGGVEYVCSSGCMGTAASGSTVTATYTSYASCTITWNRVDYQGCYLPHANFFGQSLAGANFQGAYLVNANFNWMNLAGADFNGTDLQSASFMGANLQGVNLQSADLVGAMMPYVNLSHSNLTGASFTSAMLQGANLSYDIAVSCNFSQEMLGNANLSYGDFNYANFSTADTFGAVITGATFVGATSPP